MQAAIYAYQAAIDTHTHEYTSLAPSITETRLISHENHTPESFHQVTLTHGISVAHTVCTSAIQLLHDDIHKLEATLKESTAALTIAQSDTATLRDTVNNIIADCATEPAHTAAPVHLGQSAATATTNASQVIQRLCTCWSCSPTQAMAKLQGLPGLQARLQTLAGKYKAALAEADEIGTAREQQLAERRAEEAAQEQLHSARVAGKAAQQQAARTLQHVRDVHAALSNVAQQCSAPLDAIPPLPPSAAGCTVATAEGTVQSTLAVLRAVSSTLPSALRASGDQASAMDVSPVRSPGRARAHARSPAMGRMSSPHGAAASGVLPAGMLPSTLDVDDADAAAASGGAASVDARLAAFLSHGVSPVGRRMPGQHAGSSSEHTCSGSDDDDDDDDDDDGPVLTRAAMKRAARTPQATALGTAKK